MKSRKTQWKSIPVPKIVSGGNSWERNINEIWTHINDDKSIIVQIRYLPKTKFGEMRHLSIKKIDTKSYLKNPLSAIFLLNEPTYKNKVWILNSLGKWKKIALEVFPVEDNLVDGANMFHLWELKSKDVLPFSTEEIGNTPKLNCKLSLKKCNIVYSEKTGYINKETIKYLYLKREDGKELTWYQKYHAKNEIYSSEVLAVEVIADSFAGNDYSCLVCLPYNYKLGFGIHPKD